MATIDEGPSASNERQADILSDYKILETVEWIARHSFTIVGLQFPDELLSISVPIFRSLRSRLDSDEIELYIMADTTYGSCCVDHVAAQHVHAQAVVHYGQACLSITPSLPVFYVLPKFPISDEMVERTAKRMVDSLYSMDPTFDVSNDSNQILLMYDVGYHWKSESITNCLKTNFNLPIVRHELGLEETRNLLIPPHSSASVAPSINQCSEQTCCQSSCQDSKPCSDQPIACTTTTTTTPTTNIPISQEAGSSVLPSNSRGNKTDYSSYQVVFYVGSESSRLTHFLVTHPHLPVIAVDPNQTEEDSNDHSRLQQNNRTKKLLMRRYATIQRARDADVFGILVGTLGVRHYLEMINRTKKLIEEVFKKKAYIISVGKLKPEKLMNFAEIEAWVLVDCPESSLLTLDGKTGERFDPKQFGAPIITPWELEIALNSCIEPSNDDQSENQKRVWDGKLILDFEQILSVWQAEDSFDTSAPKNGPPSPHSGDSDQQEGPVFSMVTGGYKYRRNWNDNHESESQSKEVQRLEMKDKQELIESVKGAASQYALSHRTYFGLEPRFGLDPPSKVSAGRYGIPQAYQDDHPDSAS
ncbi:Diphthamide biosynthesis protein 2 [Puccinia graminis f. sp. tritici]|uniref:2-(3-amino-3-carboxypropyl)histidine synthase subunit 2 n=2 Tax=Puccinia graminis f. sp. tritici TaxID=56615 RepID=A0A5B0NXS5_PUCGR|nr:Diphthamide biosynthesis protein 2 [Puccinia graminis f. sp. tritici]